MKQSIPREFINELLLRTDLVTLLESKIALRKRGNSYIALCPFHTEKTPSFTVSLEKQFYYCFGCSKSGNAISFLMEYEGLDFVESIHELAQLAGLTVPSTQPTIATTENTLTTALYELTQKIAQFYQHQLKHHPQAKMAIDYLKNRGLTGDIAKHYRLGFAPPGWQNLLNNFGQTADARQLLQATGMIVSSAEGRNYDRFRARIMFPIRNRKGQVIAFGGRVLDDEIPKYLNSPETALYHKGHEFYGLYEARLAHPKLPSLFVVEGYMDVIALAQHGVTNAIATLGTAITQQHLQQLLRITHEIIFCFDGDNAGNSAARRALEISLPLMNDSTLLRFLFLPEKEDPDSLIRREGKEKFLQRGQQAIPLTEFFFHSLFAEIPQNSLEAKAQLVKKAIERLNKMPQLVLKNILITELQRRLHLSDQQLQAYQQTPENNMTDNPWQRHDRAPTLSLIAKAISLLLQVPNLITTMPDTQFLTNLNLPGSDLLQELLLQLRQNPQHQTASLLEHWRDRKDAPYLNQLAMWTHAMPEANYPQELHDIFNKLAVLAHEQKIQSILTKANLQPLTVEERNTLNQLIKEQKLAAPTE